MKKKYFAGLHFFLPNQYLQFKLIAITQAITVLEILT